MELKKTYSGASVTLYDPYGGDFTIFDGKAGDTDKRKGFVGVNVDVPDGTFVKISDSKGAIKSIQGPMGNPDRDAKRQAFLRVNDLLHKIISLSDK